MLELALLRLVFEIVVSEGNSSLDFAACGFGNWLGNSTLG